MSILIDVYLECEITKNEKNTYMKSLILGESIWQLDVRQIIVCSITYLLSFGGIYSCVKLAVGGVCKPSYLCWDGTLLEICEATFHLSNI